MELAQAQRSAALLLLIRLHLVRSVRCKVGWELLSRVVPVPVPWSSPAEAVRMFHESQDSSRYVSLVPDWLKEELARSGPVATGSRSVEQLLAPARRPQPVSELLR